MRLDHDLLWSYLHFGHVLLDKGESACYTVMSFWYTVYHIPNTSMAQESTMAQPPERLSQLPDLQDKAKLDRNLLKDMAAEVLRDYISRGLIPEGTKITEREVSQMLDISRMPAREALMILEGDGLVEHRLDARYVIELTEEDVRGIHQVRGALEKLAAELAAANITEEGGVALHAGIRDLEEAVAAGDPGLCAKRDIAIHQSIWHQANNSHLLRVLESMVGVIFVLAARVKFYDSRGDSKELLKVHRELVDLVTSGDGTGAGQAVEAQLKDALMRSLRTFRMSDRANAAES
jgi:DNA-binding GntR family transcriptional regulator